MPDWLIVINLNIFNIILSNCSFLLMLSETLICGKRKLISDEIIVIIKRHNLN